MNEIAAETLDKINAMRGRVREDSGAGLLGIIEDLHDRITDLENKSLDGLNDELDRIADLFDGVEDEGPEACEIHGILEGRILKQQEARKS